MVQKCDFNKYQTFIYYSTLFFLKSIVNEKEKEIESDIYDENGNITVERHGNDFSPKYDIMFVIT